MRLPILPTTHIQMKAFHPWVVSYGITNMSDHSEPAINQCHCHYQISIIKSSRVIINHFCQLVGVIHDQKSPPWAAVQSLHGSTWNGQGWKHSQDYNRTQTDTQTPPTCQIIWFIGLNNSPDIAGIETQQGVIPARIQPSFDALGLFCPSEWVMKLFQSDLGRSMAMQLRRKSWREPKHRSKSWMICLLVEALAFLQS